MLFSAGYVKHVFASVALTGVLAFKMCRPPLLSMYTHMEIVFSVRIKQKQKDVFNFFY